MKITHLEMGLLKVQAETEAESQAICGITELLFQFMPDAVSNFHGCRKLGKGTFNWCVIPDGHLDGMDPGIIRGLKRWADLPSFYQFKRA